jgi:hypothetical protein
MKNFIAKSICLCALMVAICAQSAVAQENKQIKSLDKNGNVTSVTYQDGTSTTFTKTTSNQVSYADKVKVVNGQKRAFKPGHRNIAGELRHKVYLQPMAGAIYLIDDHEFQPLLTLKGGYETCHFIFELDFSGSWMKYTNTAEAKGHYASLAGYAGAGVKLWSSQLGYSYVAIGGSAGYAYQRTDDPDADTFSDNYGFAAKGWLRANFSLNRTLSLVGEAGYDLLPKVYHQEVQEHQDLGHGGIYAQVGLNVRF